MKDKKELLKELEEFKKKIMFSILLGYILSIDKRLSKLEKNETSSNLCKGKHN